jgi:hypothetical protein
MGRARRAEIIDSDNDVFTWMKWLNPQDGKAYIRACQPAQAVLLHYGATGDNDASELVATEAFGPRGAGNFNDWMSIDRIIVVRVRG